MERLERFAAVACEMLRHETKERKATDVLPLCLVALLRYEDDRVGIRVVLEEVLGETLAECPTVLPWIHKAIDQAIQGLKPPDDRPKDAQYVRWTVTE